jgi:PAS domain S-box-containing protein
MPISDRPRPKSNRDFDPGPQRRSLSLSHQALLLIVIPLCLELGFLFWLSLNLEQAERNTVKEGRSGTARVYVSMVLCDALNAVGSFMMYRTMGDNRFFGDVNKNLVKLREHRDVLSAFGSESAAQELEIKPFVGLADDILSMATAGKEMFERGGYASGPRITGKVKSYITRVNVLTSQIFEKERGVEGSLEAREVQSRHVRSMVKFFAAAIVFVALAFGALLGITFNRRLQQLVENTRSIAMNKPLEKTLEGGDELALFDRVIHDLSDDLARSRAQERAMIENTTELIFSLDQHQRVTQVNPAVMKILGVSDADFLGHGIQAWVHDEDRSATFAALEKSMTGSPDTSFESRIRKTDGNYIDTEWNARWSAPDQSFFCIIHDISERKNAERLKQEVMAMVSHDLRSPLASIGVTLELLSDGVLGELSEKGGDLVGKAEQSVTALIALINDLLDVERLEYGAFALDLQDCKIGDVASQAIDMIANEAEKKEIGIVADCGDWSAQIDRDGIRRVLVNLLNNAIKFSPSGSTIQIKVLAVTSKRTQKPMLEIRVSDKGAGIPADKLAVVFEKFRQAGRKDAGEKAGSGLGLAICKAIVEAHDGEIGVESKVGEGSRFWFRVKANIGMPANAAVANASGANASGANVSGANASGANAGGISAGGADPGEANAGGTSVGGVNPGGAKADGTGAGDANPGGANASGTSAGGVNPGGPNKDSA